MLSALGSKEIDVIRQVYVSVISTGDELIDLDEELTWSKKRNSNGYALEAQVRQVGAKPVQLGIVPDNSQRIKEAILNALVLSDVVILSGGVSMGDYDLVGKVLEDIGAEVQFTKVAIKPGKPITFALHNTKPIFGLPGNPVSAIICFEIFVRPALLKMMGHKDIYRTVVKAELMQDFRKKPGRKFFLRVRIERKDNHYQAFPTGPQGSGILKFLVLANALVVVPEEVTELKQGIEVEAYLLD
ncbi:MAG: molybdopterin molybdotransferase MoeA [bacterium]